MNDRITKLRSKLNVVKTKTAIEEPYYFLTRLCYTHDEHWEHKGKESPYNLFPQKEYIRDLCDLFVTEDLLVIEKSRQMMVSWIFMGLALWYTMFTPGRRTFIMSKKEQDANAMIDRIKIMYDRLPEEMKQAHVADPHTYLKLKFKNNSIIQGVPQGPDQIRQYTSSLIISDETAFQERAEEAYTAARPSLMGGGKYVQISTSNGREFHYRVVKDDF